MSTRGVERTRPSQLSCEFLPSRLWRLSSCASLQPGTLKIIHCRERHLLQLSHRRTSSANLFSPTMMLLACDGRGLRSTKSERTHCSRSGRPMPALFRMGALLPAQFDHKEVHWTWSSFVHAQPETRIQSSTKFANLDNSECVAS